MTSRRTFLSHLASALAALPVVGVLARHPKTTRIFDPLALPNTSRRFKITCRWIGPVAIHSSDGSWGMGFPNSGEYTYYADTYAPGDVTINGMRHDWEISVIDRHWHRYNPPSRA
jgi:hypothetical protein